jgi:hypothetical protein
MDSGRSASLDQDVLDVVFEFVDPRSMISSRSIDFDWRRDYERDYAYLASLCLVSKLWLVSAQRTLYRVIPPFLFRRRQFDVIGLIDFRRTIEQNTAIRQHVRRLFVDDMRDGKTLNLIRMLPRCLVFVVNRLSSVFTAEPFDLTNIGQVTLRQQSSQWFQSFQSWSRLEHIRFWSVDGESLSLDEIDDNPFPFLRSLAFITCPNHVPALPTIPNTLHTLVIKSNPIGDFTYLRDLISGHSTSLRRLSIHPAYHNPQIQTPVMELASLAGNVECLDIGEITLEEFTLLPSTLVELYIMLSMGSPNVGKAVVDLITRCRKMEVFECGLFGSETTMQDMDEAKSMAKARCVWFYCYATNDDGEEVWSTGEKSSTSWYTWKTPF